MFDLQCRARLGGMTDDGDLSLVMVDADALRPILDSLVSGTGGDILADVYIHGYKNPFIITPLTVIGDLEESSAIGIAPEPVTSWAGSGYDDRGNLVLVADMAAPWIITDDPAGEVLAGIYLTDGISGNLLGGVSLEDPLVLTLGAIIPVTLIIQLGNSTPT